MQRILGFILKYIFAAISCLYLFTFGFFFAKYRSFITKICEYFGFDVQKIGRLVIPKVKISQAISDTVSIRLRELIAEDGDITLLELVVVNNLISAYQPKKIFEIGTFEGRTTLNMASNCPDDAIVYTLDLSKEKINSAVLPIAPGDKQFINKEKPGSKYRDSDVERKIVQLLGDSAIFDFTFFYNTIDFVFVDGSHSYEYVLNDSKIAIQLLKNQKGIILWHDYKSWEGVTEALDELYVKNTDFKHLRHIEGTSLVYLFMK